MQSIGLFGAGIFLLLWATNQLVNLTTRLAYSLRLSPLIVGVTIVAIGTSLPELVVSTIATLNGDFALSVGNIIGSNSVNILLVFGLAILFGKIKVGTIKTQKTLIILLAVTIAYMFSFKFRIHSLSFFSLALAFSFLEYMWGIEGRKLEDKIRLTFTHAKPLSLVEYFFLLVCLFGIYVGGVWVVQAVEKISEQTGYSTHILGLSLTAVTTSLPEILTTMISIKKKQEKLMIGNIMGSNIYNILLIGGVSNIWIKDFTLHITDIFWLLSTAFLFGGIVYFYRGRVIPRIVGFMLILICLAYFTTVYYPG